MPRYIVPNFVREDLNLLHLILGFLLELQDLPDLLLGFFLKFLQL